MSVMSVNEEVIVSTGQVEGERKKKRRGRRKEEEEEKKEKKILCNAEQSVEAILLPVHFIRGKRREGEVLGM
tara:strand:- start:840 stop:1055 length:216 start_codon:yes stop_codon:yes gene_type:complete